MHAVLSRSKYARYSGTLQAGDFVETPSLLLEHWCWVPEVLKKLSRHYKNDAKIPDNLINHIIRSRQVDGRMLTMFQVVIATFDLTVFTPASQKDAQEMDLAEIWYDLTCKIGGIQGPENW
jgi:Zn-dependent oligopeptidase